MKPGIKRWRGRHVGPKWIVLAHRWLNRHERRNSARIARYSDRQGWATKPKYAQLRHEYELGKSRERVGATEGKE